MITAVFSPSRPLADRARDVAAVAAQFAAAVDAEGRFPHEMLAAAREARLLSALVPTEFGGDGASITEVAETCTIVAQACGSSGMVLAMHHIQIGCLVRHVRGYQVFEAYLAEIAEHQHLLASVTSEVGVGGDTRSSICAVDVRDGVFSLTKDATTISYGEHADTLLVTCRRAPDAASNDQVLVLLRRHDYTLERKGNWETMGMRGTQSPPFLLTASGPASQILPASYGDLSAQSMVPFSHILWASLWMGIASDAVARAGAFVRAQARKTPGVLPPTATRYAELSVLLQSMRQQVAAAAAEFDGLGDKLDELSTMGWALRLNNLKIAASEAAPGIVHKALQIIGIMGYKRGTPFSVERHYRDVLSAALMVGNERILAKNASILLVLKDGQA